MARTACISFGAALEERARRVYLIEELSLSGKPQSPAIVKVGQAGLDPDKARRACERGNARTLVVRYFTDPLTIDEAAKVEHTVHRWLHKQAIQREWFECPNIDYPQQAIDRAFHSIRNPNPTANPDLNDFVLRHPAAPTVPDSPIARTIAALRAQRKRASDRGEVEKASRYDRRIERLLSRDHVLLDPEWSP
jgi:hypothetical protein